MALHSDVSPNRAGISRNVTLPPRENCFLVYIVRGLANDIKAKKKNSMAYGNFNTPAPPIVI